MFEEQYLNRDIPISLADKIAWVVKYVPAPEEGWNAVECLRVLRERKMVNEWVDVIQVADEAKKLGYRQ